jgi:hypothetical protein
MSPDLPSRTRFFVAVHKPWPLPKHPLYTAIGVGGYRPESPDNILSDACGDNIASRNSHYSELTAWYWIWKNVRDVDTVGLCHFRRYFFFHTQHRGFASDKLYVEPTAENMEELFSMDPEPLIAQVRRQNGIVVPRPVVFPGPISWHYAFYHRRTDWDAFLTAITETSPAHARQLHLFDTERKMYLYNMMVAPWSFFDDYMAMLMAVIERVESLISYPSDAYQKRVPAFLAERLFTLHLLTTKSKLWEVPVLITDKSAY